MFEQNVSYLKSYCFMIDKNSIMKNIFFTLSLLFISSICFAQIKVIANGDVGVGTPMPSTKLVVDKTLTATNQFVGMFTNSSNLNGFGIVANAGASGNANIGLTVAGSPKGNIGYDVSRGFLGFLNQNYSAADFQLRFNDNGTLTFHNAGGPSRFIVQTNGTTGIGAVTPGAVAAGSVVITGEAYKPGGGSWVNSSDRRLKKNINKFEDGLDEIMKITPVNFYYNGKGGIKKTDKEYVGVIAQDIQKVAPYMVEEFEHVKTELVPETHNKGANGETRYNTVITGSENYLAVDPNAFTYMLINAVKEQQEIIEELNSRLNDLELQLDGIVQGDLEDNEHIENVILSSHDFAELSQNNPNPFNGITTIKFIVPINSERAELLFHDYSGNLIKSVTITNRGEGYIRLTANDIPAGNYTYSLKVDGKITDTKSMNLVK